MGYSWQGSSLGAATNGISGASEGQSARKWAWGLWVEGISPVVTEGDTVFTWLESWVTCVRVLYWTLPSVVSKSLKKPTLDLKNPPPPKNMDPTKTKTQPR